MPYLSSRELHEPHSVQTSKQSIHLRTCTTASPAIHCHPFPLSTLYFIRAEGVPDYLLHQGIKYAPQADMSREKRRKRDRLFGWFTHGPSAARQRETIAPSVRDPSTRTTQRSTPLLETQPRGATRDVALESNPPRLTFTTAAENDTVHTQVGNEGEGQPVPTATGNTEAQSLWSRAVKGLSSEEQTLLAGIGIDTNTRQVVSDVGALIEGIVKNQNGKDWKIPFNGEQIVMRDIGMKILRWADRFKHIGDIIVQ